MESSVVSTVVEPSTVTGSEVVVLQSQKNIFQQMLKHPEQLPYIITYPKSLISKNGKGSYLVTPTKKPKKPKKSPAKKTSKTPRKTLKRSHLTAFDNTSSSSKDVVKNVFQSPVDPPKKKSKKNVQKPVGLLNPKMKNLKPPDFQVWWKKLKQERRIIYGIDMSLTNPGLCILNPLLKRIHLFCFRNRQKESSGISIIEHTSSPFKGWSLELSILEERDNEKEKPLFLFSLFRFIRYEERLQKLLSLIGNNTRQDKLVGIEGYSYNSKATQADTFLKELGGCLRLSLCRMKHNILEIPPSTIKKIFSAQGQSTKKDMYSAYAEKFYLPDLFALMNLGDAKNFQEIPHPIEDIVDSLAVALSVLYLI